MIDLCEQEKIVFLPWAPIQDLDGNAAVRELAHRHDASPRQIVLAWLLARSPSMPPNRTVADEYFAVTEKVEALYGQPQQLPADAIGPKMARLRREHHRLLGNGSLRAGVHEAVTRVVCLDCVDRRAQANQTFGGSA